MRFIKLFFKSGVKFQKATNDLQLGLIFTLHKFLANLLQSELWLVAHQD